MAVAAAAGGAPAAEAGGTHVGAAALANEAGSRPLATTAQHPWQESLLRCQRRRGASTASSCKAPARSWWQWRGELHPRLTAVGAPGRWILCASSTAGTGGGCGEIMPMTEERERQGGGEAVAEMRQAATAGRRHGGDWAAVRRRLVASGVRVHGAARLAAAAVHPPVKTAGWAALHVAHARTARQGRRKPRQRRPQMALAAPVHRLGPHKSWWSRLPRQRS
jgi:hypothetical protein